MKSIVMAPARSGLLAILAAILIVLALDAASHANGLPTPITWGSAMNISFIEPYFGDPEDAPPAIPPEFDVNTTGTLFGAFNLGTTGVPGANVNGVPFVSFPITNPSNTAGDFTFSLTGSVYATNTAFGSGAEPFSTVGPNYAAILGSGAAALGGEIQLVIEGLTVGHTYLFQCWSNDSGPQFFPYSTIVSAGNVTQINDNTTGYVAGGLGQHVSGTFLADSNTQTITFSGVALAPVLNAFQLRTIAVPEPASAMLLGGAGMMLMLNRRRGC